MNDAGGRRPPLAVLIPTYSRRHQLERLLRLLAVDPAIRAARIPVLVADNHSTDDTVVAVRVDYVIDVVHDAVARRASSAVPAARAA